MRYTLKNYRLEPKDGGPPGKIPNLEIVVFRFHVRKKQTSTPRVGK